MKQTRIPSNKGKERNVVLGETLFRLKLGETFWVKCDWVKRDWANCYHTK